MELLAFIFVWPFLLLALGILFIAGNDVFGASLWHGSGYALQVLVFSLIAYIVYAAIFRRGAQGSKIGGSVDQQLEELKRGMVVLSIALLLPIFIRYLVQSFKGDLLAMVVALLIAFALASWGLFVKGNKTLMYGNVFGGLFSLMYLYSQLWSLGEGARVVAAGFGLVMAVTLSVVKLKGKLT